MVCLIKERHAIFGSAYCTLDGFEMQDGNRYFIFQESCIFIKIRIYKIHHQKITHFDPFLSACANPVLCSVSTKHATLRILEATNSLIRLF